MVEGPKNPLLGSEPPPRRSLRRLIKDRVYRGPFQEALEKAPGLIEAGEYSAAFGNFARQLDELAFVQDLNGKNYQKNARSALGELWRMFVQDIHSHSQLSKRLNAFDDIIDIEVRRGLAENKKRSGPPLANFSKKAVENFIDDYIRHISAPIDEPYNQNLEHIEFVGEMYNNVLPLLEKKMAGYVKQIIKGHPTLPVNAELVRARIVALLDIAPQLTGMLVAAEMTFKEMEYNARHT